MEPLWNDDGSLTVINRLEAFVTHPITGERIYRAGIHGYGLNGPRQPASVDLAPRPAPRRSARAQATSMALGDGTDIDAREERQLVELLDAITRVWPWNTGDLMILDNLETAHGRNPYVGVRETEVALLA